jgi:hypothetical protein
MIDYGVESVTLELYPSSSSSSIATYDLWYASLAFALVMYFLSGQPCFFHEAQL